MSFDHDLDKIQREIDNAKQRGNHFWFHPEVPDGFIDKIKNRFKEYKVDVRRCNRCSNNEVTIQF